MGKAARNRAAREQRAEEQQRDADALDSIPQLFHLSGHNQFQQHLSEHPGLLAEQTIRATSNMRHAAGYGPLFAGVHRLLAAARTDPHAAWDTFAAERREADARGARLEAAQHRIDTEEETGDIPLALELVERSLSEAGELGLGMTVCELLHRRGRLQCRLNTARRAEEIEEALGSYEAALEVAVGGEQAARILMHRGLAFAERVKGDPAENNDRAISSLEDALAQLDDTSDPELRAMMQTNLSVALVRGRHGSADGPRAAVELCRQALTHRTPGRDADNWAYTKINLGYALRALAELDDSPFDDARNAYLEVLAHRDKIGDRAVLGAAHHALGRLDLAAADHTASQMVAAHEDGRLNELYENTGVLTKAREHLQAALELTPAGTDPVGHVRILDDLTSALEQLGEDEQALALARQGLALITADGSPVTAKELAWRAAAILSRRGDWPAAAQAFTVALAAAEFTLNAPVDTSAWAAQVRATGNLHRWAAYSYARAGDPQAAAVALDTGRARELQRRLGLNTRDQQILRRLPAELRAAYETAVREVLASPLDAADSDPARRLAGAVAAIRELPGNEMFRVAASWQDITAAVTEQWPLVYLNPTPEGTLLLLLHQPAGGEVTAEAEFIDVTSTQVFMRMMVSGGEIDESRGSYLVAASGQGNDYDIAARLDELLPWLAQHITGSLDRLLVRSGADAATLVLCGTLDLAPIHAAALPDSAGTLGERYTLRYAPSATVCAAAITRAREAEGRPPRLVALADPNRNLPAAAPEVTEITALFDPDASTCATGDEATLGFLHRHAPDATHLHLACHARGGLFDAGDAAIELASGPLPAGELPAITRLTTRLVVVSACQSAQATMGGLLQSEFSIASALLAAGAACVIASLWPVDDLASALLMTRLYQQLQGATPAPPEALRAAQRWLRELTEPQEQTFLERHPGLAAEYRRRLAAGGPPGRRGAHDGTAAVGGAGPYAHPDYWAAFIAIGA